MNHEQYQSIIKGLWSLASGGLSNLTIKNMSSHFGLDESELIDLFPNQHNIILALIADIKSKVTLPEVDERLTRRDQIFDGVMYYFDVAHPNRLEIKKLYHDILWNPIILSQVLSELYRVGEGVTQRYFPEDGLLKAGRILAFNGAFTHAFREFIDDETFDLSKTMAALDQGLKTVDDLIQRFC